MCCSLVVTKLHVLGLVCGTSGISYHKSDHTTPTPLVFDPNINVHLGRLMRPYHKITFQYNAAPPRPPVLDKRPNCRTRGTCAPGRILKVIYETGRVAYMIPQGQLNRM